MTFPIIPASTVSGGYQISRSLRFRSSASAYLSRTPASAGNRQKWTWSGWVKRGAISGTMQLFHAGTSGANTFYIEFSNDGTDGDSLVITDYQGAYNARLKTTAVYRDVSSWYSLVVSVDTTQATTANRIRIYINGIEVTTFATSTYPPQNTNLLVNSSVEHAIGRWYSGATRYFDGYLAEVNFIDGQALTPSSFGAFDTNGVWQPAKYTGSYGTNGFYLNFSDNSGATATTIGKDSSGNSNNWTPNNISVTSGTTYDSMIDSPTNYADGGNGRGNYAVINPIDVSPSTVVNGNLNISYATNADTNRAATFGVNSGKWYWETTITAVGGTYSIVGITSGASTATALGSSSYQYGYISSTGNKFNNGSAVAYGATYTTGDVIGIALDMDAGTLVFYKNNASQGTAYTGLTGTFFPAFNARNASSNDANFGQRPFTYTPPSGFSALNTQNLPTPTIANGAQYMGIATYAGNAGSNSYTSLSFQPDFLWSKSRTSAAYHYLFDSVRGTSKAVYSNATDAEGTITTTVTFNTNGVAYNGSESGLNANTQSYVNWLWNAGGAPTTDNVAGAGNVPTAGSVKINGANSTSALAGSIAATRLSANTSAGFSVVTFTGNGTSGATVGHGLGVAPSMIIVKSRSVVDGWGVYHISLGATKYLVLNTTAAAGTLTALWNDTAPTSSVFSLGNSTAVNTNGATQVAYCFAPVAGYSAFGSYTGNGSADGPFVYLGFLPRWLLVKRTDAAGYDWFLVDTSRATYNQIGPGLSPNTSGAEFTLGSPTGGALDILSNGFKRRGSAADLNASGGTYIYAAFAENPFRIARAR